MNKEIPIFDSLTHPMPNGNWISETLKGSNTVQNLISEMEDNSICASLAVGMGTNIGNYDEKSYASYIRNNSDNIFPIAFINFEAINSIKSITEYLQRLKKIGYFGVKIHPRFSQINFNNPFIPSIIKEANQLGLAVLICTYFWSNNKNLCSNSPEQLMSLLCEIPDEKVILLHGGAVRILEAAEIVRHFPKALLDLSFTLTKYEGSSIDLDLQYLFQNFDRRICVGSDSPELSIKKLRDRFNFFCTGLDQDKAKNIGYKNLQNITGINLCR